MGGLGRGSQSWTYALDVAGQRMMQADRPARRPHLPGRPMWAHALTVAEVYTRTVEALRGSQSQLGLWQGEPDSWRRYSGPYGEALTLKPDAALRIDGPAYADLYFLEIDTGTQSRTVIRDKAAAYRRYAATGLEQRTEGVFPRVTFLTTTTPRLAVLTDVLAEQPSESWQLFSAGLVEDTARLLVPEADQ